MRRSGKTLTMVKKLQQYSTVCVFSENQANYIRHMIYDIKGLEFLNTIRIRIINNTNIHFNFLRGLNEVAIDHAVFENLNENKINELKRFIK